MIIVNNTRKCGALCLSAQVSMKNLALDKATLHNHTTLRKVYEIYTLSRL